ncbi:MAG: peptide ABC transporter substrate-binding protein [Candidatus Hydrogenedentota bacterium]|nr:MAG: peptide ABC transporter substrate-binding protein [Candidatus Hydrogenedentota bacterium]
MTTYKRNCIFSILVLCTLLVTACSGPNRQSAPSGSTNLLRVGSGAEPKSLDPHAVTGVTEDRLLSALFEGLVNMDLATLEPLPGAAAAWEMSEDGTEYTFHLREDAQWSNGETVTAHDFLYAWERILNPAFAAEYGYMLYPLLNAEAYNAGSLSDFSQVGAKAVDDHTLLITLRAPTSYFLSLHVHYTWFPLNQKAVEAHGKTHERDTPWTRPGNLVSNGAYTLTDWIPNKHIKMQRNEHYWGRNDVSISELAFYPTQNPSVEERSFRAGDLDLTYTVPLTKIQTYQRNDPQRIRIDPYLGTEFFRFNITRPPFDDIRVRKAFGLALERDTLVKHVLKGGQIPALAFTPPGTAGYTSTYETIFNPETARKLLAEAGYPGGSGFPSVELLYDTSDNNRLYVEAVQHLWKTHLGVEIHLVNQDVKTWLANMIGLNYSIARSYWIGDYEDPGNFLEMFYTGSGNNRTGFSSPEYETLLREAALTLDTTQRHALYDQAEHILLESGAIAPVYHHTRPYLVQPRVRNLQSNLLGRIDFKMIRLE